MRRLLVALCAALAACGDDPTQAACARMQRHIEKLLGGKFPGAVPVEIVDVDFIGRFAADLERTMIAPGLVETAKRLSERMKFVPPGFDITGAQIELVKQIVVGLYDPQKDLFYLVEGRATPGTPEFAETIAHELVHAYRDIDKRYFENTLAAVSRNADQAVAISCLTEGDATLLGQALGPLLSTGGDPTPLLKLFASQADVIAASLGTAAVPPQLQKFPYGLREMALGRYGAGLVFAAKLYAHGGTAALEKAFDDPPRSTEQVLHPEKYIGPEKDEPTIFAGGDPTAALGEGWTMSMANTIGEFELRVQFGEVLGRDAAWKAAGGWDGARYYFCEKKGLPGFVGVITTWDTEKDAKEFADAWSAWAAKRDSGSGVEAVIDRVTMVTTDDGLVAIRTTGKDVLIADGVPKDRIEAVFAALASATRK